MQKMIILIFGPKLTAAVTLRVSQTWVIICGGHQAMKFKAVAQKTFKKLIIFPFYDPNLTLPWPWNLTGVNQTLGMYGDYQFLEMCNVIKLYLQKHFSSNVVLFTLVWPHQDLEFWWKSSWLKPCLEVIPALKYIKFQSFSFNNILENINLIFCLFVYGWLFQANPT